MKKVLSILICFAMILGLCPIAAMAEESTKDTPTITINQKQIVVTVGETSTNYNLQFGRASHDGSFVTDAVSKIIDAPDTVTEIDWYVLLLDNAGNEAPQSVYQAFWEACGGKIYLRKRSETTAQLCTELKSNDGYHKYITDTVVGAYSGQLLNLIFWIGEENIGAACDGNIMLPTDLKLDANGQANYTIENAVANTTYVYRIDLDCVQVATVSAEITTADTHGRIDLYNGNNLWNYFYDSSTPNSYPRTINSREIIILVRPFSSGTVSGSVTVEVEQSHLMYRYMSYDSASKSWYENTNDALYDIERLTVAAGQLARVRLYYGLSTDYQAVVPVSSDETIVKVETVTARDGDPFYYIRGAAFGTAKVSCGQYQFNLTVDLPAYGYYSERIRDKQHFLSVANTAELTDNTLWFMSENGFTESDTTSGQYTVIAGDGTEIPFAWVKRDDSSTYDMKISLTGSVNLVMVKRNGSNWLSVQVTSPGLMYRYMSYNRETNTWYESTEQSLRSLSSLTLKKGEAAKIRLYYGTASEYQMMTGLTSDAVSVANVSEGTAEDGKGYYIITAGDFGAVSLRCGEHQFEVVVGLPYYGFYSNNTQTTETYLSEITLTGNESDLKKVWFIGEYALKNSDTDTITVTVGGTDITSTNATVVNDCILEITLPSDAVGPMYYIEVQRNGENLRGIKVTLPGSGDDPSGGEVWQSDYATYIDDYVIGFAKKQSDGEVTTIWESPDFIFGHGTFDYGANVSYAMEDVLHIAAATKGKDSENATTYTVIPEITNSVKIKRLWIEPVSGDTSTFSWSGDRLVTELTSVQGQDVPLYVKEGRDCRATVCAEISVTVDGKTYEKTVRANIGLTLIEGGTLTRPDNDTTEQLNAFLKELAENLNTTDEKNELYHINLGNTTYEGTIEVPDAFVRPYACLHFNGASGIGKKTVIKGSLNINGANIERIQNIHFVADEAGAEQTKAIYGGGLRDVLNCSFYDYDIALDSSEGLIVARGSVFVNNTIAASVKINNSMNAANVLPGEWSNNTFINNEIALQIVSLSNRVSPYYFRVYDSNFINNGIDIDARCGGTLYMYRNYFGQYKEQNGRLPKPGKHHADRYNGRDDLRLDELLSARTEDRVNGMLMSTRAKVYTENQTEVITNPRWQHPVKGWWNHHTKASDIFFGTTNQNNALMTLSAEEYQDKLIVDWEDETRILNDESESLLLDASAFQEDGKKEIDILDENEVTLGTWNFD